MDPAYRRDHPDAAAADAAERLEAISERTVPAPMSPRRPRSMHTLPDDLGHTVPPDRGYLRLPLLPGFENTLREHLRAALGPEFGVDVDTTPEPAPPALPIPVPFYEAHELAAHQDDALRYDVRVRFPDGDTVVYRVTRMAGGAPLPRNLVINLILLLLSWWWCCTSWRAASPGRCRTWRARPTASAATCALDSCRSVAPRAARRGARLQHHAGPPATLSRQPHAGAGGDVARPENAADAAAAAGRGAR